MEKVCRRVCDNLNKESDVCSGYHFVELADLESDSSFLLI